MAIGRGVVAEATGKGAGQGAAGDDGGLATRWGAKSWRRRHKGGETSHIKRIGRFKKRGLATL